MAYRTALVILIVAALLALAHFISRATATRCPEGTRQVRNSDEAAANHYAPCTERP